MSHIFRAALALLVLSCGAPPLPTTVQSTPSDLVARGESLYHLLGCAHCHEPNDLGRSTGPALGHIGSIAATRRPGMSAEDYLRQSILDPYAYLVPGYEDFVSRSFAGTLRPDEVDALVAYLMSLK